MRNRSILAAVVCSFLLGLSPLAADSTIQRGIDVFTTRDDGRTYYDFAQSPIPAGFFCKGSKPFTGRVAPRACPSQLEPQVSSGMRTRSSSGSTTPSSMPTTPPGRASSSGPCRW